MTEELLLKTLIDNNFSLLGIIWTSGMIWCLASATFSLSLVRTLHIERESLIARDLKASMGVFVAFFFICLTVFNVYVVYFIYKIEESMYDLIISNCPDFHIVEIHHLFAMINALYIFCATISFVFIVVWLYVWFSEETYKILKGPST